MALTYLAGNRISGLSGDTKPSSNVNIGTTFLETNTDDLYMWDGDSWNLVAGDSIAQTLSNKTLTSPVLNTGLSGTAFLDEDNFASDSATKVASQQSIKAYVASQVPGSQNVFNTIAVSGQDNVVADSATDTLTFAAGSNITLTTTAGSDTVTIAASSSSATVTVTDNEDTNENNLITFVADAATSNGAHGLEMDGHLHYNPSTGTITATTFAGALTGNASGSAATVTGATQAAITTASNLVTVGALDSGTITSNFGTINVGSSTITTSGVITAGGFTIGSAAITEAELEILDGAAVTTAELNIIDGNTAATSTTLADADRVVVNDNGTMVQVALTDFETYFETSLDTLSNVTTVGTLNSGSITNGFGAIDVGSSAITTTGTVTAGNLSITGDTTTFNTATVTVEDPLMALASNNSGNAVDIGFYGKYVDSGTKYTGLAWDGSASRYILFHGNTAAPTTTVDINNGGHAVSTLVANLVGNVTGDTSGSSGSTTGNAATATRLATARTIGGTSFNGTTDIAVALAATATELANARTIGGVSFNGTVNINLPGVNATGNQDTSGNATTASALATGRTISASGDITWTSASFTGSQNVTSVAAITADVIVNDDIKSDAAIVDTKLATISTADKVAGGAIQIDSGTDGTGITVADADKLLIDDGGTTKYINASQIKTYAASAAGASESFAIAMAVAL